METAERQWVETLYDGSTVVVRPLRRTDIGAEREFVGGLSPHSRRMRFLGEFAGLPDAELRRLVDVDGVRKVAFAAFDSCDRLVGVSRFSCDADPRGCECAVAVADAWQGVGLGTCLMRHLVDAAREHGIRRMWSLDFACNTEMQELAKFLGFASTRCPNDPGMVMHELTLR